jgi:hypothetical protein
MSALQLAELDYIYKKTAASTVKTDNATSSILATSQSIFTSPIMSSDNVWTESATLELGPNFASSIVSLQTRVKMTSAHGVGPNPDIVALTGVAWTSGITNWVDKKFHIGFAPTFEVASGTNPAPGDYKTIDNSSDYPMIFDYKSGVLTFLVTPYAANGVDLTAKTGTDTTWHVYITGYTYLGGTLEEASQQQQQFSDPIAIGTGAGNYLQGDVDFQAFANLEARPGKDLTLNWTTIGLNTFDVSAYMAANDVNYCRLEMTAVGGGGGTIHGFINQYFFPFGGGSGGIINNITIENVSGVITGNVGKGSDPATPSHFYEFESSPFVHAPGVYAGDGGDTIVSVNGRAYIASGGKGARLYEVLTRVYPTIYYKGGPGIGGTPNGVAGISTITALGGVGPGGGQLPPTRSTGGGTLISIAPDIYPFGSGGDINVDDSRGTQGIIKLKLKFFNANTTQSVSPLSPVAGSIAIGVNAGAHIQQKNAIAIGHNAGQTGQGSNAIAIGYNAGQTGQGNPGPLGSYYALQRTTPGSYSINTAILTGAPFQKVEITMIAGGGASAFFVNPATPGGGGGGGGIRSLTLTNVTGVISFTVGAGSPGGSILNAGESTVVIVITNGTSQTYTVTGGTDGAQSRNGLAGAPGGFDSRGPLGALGYEFTSNFEGSSGVRSSIEGGIGAGGTYAANQYVKGVDGGVLIRLYYTGPYNSSAIAIGPDSGRYNQYKDAIAIGNSAGLRDQASNSICIGTNAGIAADRSIVPAQNSVSIGINSQIPGINSVAVGAGSRGGTVINGTSRGYATAVGFSAGANENGVAIGREASADGVYSVAIGFNSKTKYDGNTLSGEPGGVAVGTGSRSSGNGLALGRAAEANDGQVTLNASLAYLTPPSKDAGFYVHPVRNGDPNTATSGILEYNAARKEITYRDLLPKYSVIMWYSTGPPPPGWVLCNGENGTPNMSGVDTVMASGGTGDTRGIGADTWQTGQFYAAVETGQNRVGRQKIIFIMKLY